MATECIPNLKDDNVINVAFSSTGYFIYDFFDMLFNQKLSQSWELLFHHVVVGLARTLDLCT